MINKLRVHEMMYHLFNDIWMGNKWGHCNAWLNDHGGRAFQLQMIAMTMMKRRLWSNTSAQVILQSGSLLMWDFEIEHCYYYAGFLISSVDHLNWLGHINLPSFLITVSALAISPKLTAPSDWATPISKAICCGNKRHIFRAFWGYSSPFAFTCHK